MCVGKTKQTLPARLCGYVAEARRGTNLKSLHWVRSLLSDGVRPGIRLLATTRRQHWIQCERRHISIWRKRNPDLLNVHDGGNGIDSAKRLKYCRKCGSKLSLKLRRGFRCRKCRNKYTNKYYRRNRGKRLAYLKSSHKTDTYRAYANAYMKKWYRRNLKRNRERKRLSELRRRHKMQKAQKASRTLRSAA